LNALSAARRSFGGSISRDISACLVHVRPLADSKPLREQSYLCVSVLNSPCVVFPVSWWDQHICCIVVAWSFFYCCRCMQRGRYFSVQMLYQIVLSETAVKILHLYIWCS
jgi:hypothetical protein